jgi:hypothetical protein
MPAWLYPIAKKPHYHFYLKGGKKLLVTAENFEKLVRSGRLKEDKDWFIAANFRRVQPGDELFVYTGDGDLGIIGYAIIKNVDRDERRLHLNFDKKKSEALLDTPVPADVVRRWFRKQVRMRTVENITRRMSQLRTSLPWTRECQRSKILDRQTTKQLRATFRETSFKPEFSGQKQAPVSAKPAKSQVNHGIVVNTLQRHLKARGVGAVGNDQNRDLYLATKKNQMRILFEVKTNISTSSVYQGVGQLTFHCAGLKPDPKRVLVLPGKPNAKTNRTLEHLNIKVLHYRLQGGRAIFEKLDDVL